MNRKQLDSFKQSLMNIISEDSFDRQAAREKRIQEREARLKKQAESDALEVQVKQEMANARKIQGANFDQNDEYAVRAWALDKLSGNEEFVKRANSIGQVVGKFGGGSGSRGRFEYRHATQKSADEASKASRDQLFDAEGNARLPDFENKKYDPNTGKWNVPMIGKADQPIKTATTTTTNQLAAADMPNSDIAAARAMEAQNRGDSASGRSVNSNGTVDDAGRYAQLQQQNADRTQARVNASQANASSSRFSLGTGSRGQPIVTGGSYKDPYTNPESIAQRWDAESKDPESPMFDREASTARENAAKAAEANVRANAAASLPSAQARLDAAKQKLAQMERDNRLRQQQRSGGFGRPVSGQTQRTYPPPSNPNTYQQR